MMVRHYCLDEEEEVVRMLRKEGMELERAERVARDEGCVDVGVEAARGA
jgi:hypothetical protein